MLRVKYNVRPSGAKVGEPSFAGLEITPGAKICGEISGAFAGELKLDAAATEWPCAKHSASTNSASDGEQFPNLGTHTPTTASERPLLWL